MELGTEGGEDTATTKHTHRTEQGTQCYYANCCVWTVLYQTAPEGETSWRWERLKEIDRHGADGDEVAEHLGTGHALRVCLCVFVCFGSSVMTFGPSLGSVSCFERITYRPISE